MKSWIQWMGVLAVLAGMGCGRKAAETVTPQTVKETDVAVWVDQVGITVGEVQREAQRLFANRSRNASPDQAQALQMRALQQAVDNLIIRQLVKSEMERSGILITQAEIEQAKKDLEKGLGPGLSLAALMAAADVSTEVLESNLRLDIFKNRMLKNQVDEAVNAITEETAKTYYDEHPDEFTLPEGRIASHILIRVPKDADDATRMDRRAKAEAIRKSLLEGADFAQVAREVSECPVSRPRGGDMGVVPRGRETPEFEEAVYRQPIGEISEVVESPAGYHIIRVTGEQAKKVFPFEEVKEQLITTLKNRAHVRITQEYIDGLRKKSTIRWDGPFAAKGPEGSPPPAADPSSTPPAETGTAPQP